MSTTTYPISSEQDLSLIGINKRVPVAVCLYVMLIAIVKGTNHVECPPEERHIIITKNEKHQLQCLSNVCNGISERNLKKLEEAKMVHDYFLRSGITSDVGLVHKMIDMYCKNGLGDDGLEMYEQMRNNGLFSNEETFLAVLNCVGCYGKPGHLAEALEYIQTLLYEPTSGIWEVLMNYARIHGDIDLEDRSVEILINLDPSKVDPKKIPTPLPNIAISMLEGKNRVGEFRNLTLYKDEEKLRAANKEQSYVPETRHVLHDILNEIQLAHEKEDGLVVVVVKVVHECRNWMVDCRMVVNEIEDGLLEEMEKFGWWFEQHIGGESEDDKEKKLVMVNEEGWMS
nr:pentatricopeptide repeat-containing protein At2g15690 [Tanacetum cinerariifolium]